MVTQKLQVNGQWPQLRTGFFPACSNFAMRNRALERYRRATVSAAHGIVLEIGVGSGLNLGLYDGNVDRAYALEPSAELLAMARRRAAQAAVPVSFVRASGEQLPFPDTV